MRITHKNVEDILSIMISERTLIFLSIVSRVVGLTFTCILTYTNVYLYTCENRLQK